MTTVTAKQPVGTKNSLTSSSLATLASGNYCVSAAYDCTVNQPLDVEVEVSIATTNTPSGNKQAVVFIQESLDGTTYRSGPTSGSTTTDEGNLKRMDAIPMNSSSVTQTATFSVVGTLGFVPAKFKIVVKNDLGVALTSGTISTAEVTTTVS